VGRPRTIDDEALLRVARDLFRRGGHAAATRDIASAAGISQGVLFQRFGSKEDLFLRAMTPEAPDVDALLGPYPPRSAKADLRRIAERLVAFFAMILPTLLQVLAHPDLGAARLKKWHARLPFPPILHGLAARLRRMDADGLVATPDPEAAAQMLLAAVHSVALLETMADGARSDHRTRNAAALVDVLWAGLAPRRP
jgi:AcrR family transcriptional regulator